MKKKIERTLSLTGLALIALSVLLYAALELSSRSEQAQSPGEKSMGVAVLGLAYGIPMLVCAVIGVLFLLAGVAVFLYKQFFRRTPN